MANWRELASSGVNWRKAVSIGVDIKMILIQYFFNINVDILSATLNAAMLVGHRTHLGCPLSSSEASKFIKSAIRQRGEDRREPIVKHRVRH